jgi:NAD(P)-dependent dehydrogenase (short-subunit alcohol dehydrogenase family)
MGKVIISCAITGSIHTPSMSPHLPVTPAEIAESALEATEAGGDRPSPRPQSRGWPTRPESGGVRAVPQGDPGELRSPRRDRDRRLEGLYARGPRSNSMMRAGSRWDVAEACVYLAGPSGGFLTGETLTVDGGATFVERPGPPEGQPISVARADRAVVVAAANLRS